jgi:hypothetical protein
MDMKLRRIALALSAVALIAGAALGAGVALGSGSSNAQTPPDKSPGGEASMPRVPKPTKPKSQAYVHFLPDGTITGALTKKVLAVHHTGTGRYCVDLASSIHVSADTFIQLTVDYFNSSPEFMVAMSGSPGVCSGLGFANSVRILTDSNDTGAAAAADVAVFLTIP